MSYTILHEKIKTARKTYDCAASEWINNGYSIQEFIDDYKLPFSERRMLAKAKTEKFKVLPGTKYIEQVGIFDGDFYCIQCRPDISALITKYGINQEY
ncbi:MAG: hypothetical protein WC401_07225 [Bacteroidales bacterium]